MPSFFKIKVIGIGGAGGNIVSQMVNFQLPGLELIALNTDLQDLKKIKVPQKIAIGQKLTKGLGTGMNPILGEKAALQDQQKLKQFFKDAKMIFFIAGLGGGTGTGALPIFTKLAKKEGILTLVFVTLPFSFEGKIRQKIAKEGLEKLQGKFDSLITIENDKILALEKEKEISLKTAFSKCNQVLKEAIEGIVDLIFLPGILNVDFADIRTIMKDSGNAFLGIGRGKGKKRGEMAAKEAVFSPFLKNFPLNQAKGILFNIAGKDITLAEIEKISQIITQNASREAKIIFGASENKRLKNKELKVTLIATGFQI